MRRQQPSSFPRVFVTGRLPPGAFAGLEAAFSVVSPTGGQPARQDLLRLAAGSDGLLVFPRDLVNEALLDAAGPQLRIVANYGSGYDNIDIKAATDRGVVVANTQGVPTRATAELTIALILSLLRRVSEGDRFVRAKAPWTGAPMLGRGLTGLTLGIVGLGRIGREVASIAEVFDMSIVYASPRQIPNARYERLTLAKLLSSTDIVSLHCPLTPDTRHLIDTSALAMMRKDAVLINTTRGQVVDESALVEALATGRIAGAALDVYEHEPVVHPGLLELPNVVLSPHMGSATRDTREAMGRTCVDALRAVLIERRLPANAINTDNMAPGSR